MKNASVLPFKNHMLLLPMFFVLTLWLVFWVEVKWDVSFNTWGVLPREFVGLRGVVFSPFIHSDASHLWHNTLPLFILSTALFYFYQGFSKKVWLIGFFATGIATWVIGRHSYHIGASGIIYMLFGFLLLKGLLTMHLRLLAVSFFVVFVYGGMIWYIVPIDYKISWEGHLSGLLVGFFLALSRKKTILQTEKPKYEWEAVDYDASADPFMQCFDENGRFVPSTTEEPVKEVGLEEYTTTTTASGIRLIYDTLPTKRPKKVIISYNFKKEI